MPANVAPIYPINGIITWGTIAAANTATDGTGTVVTVATAGVEGHYIQKLVIRPLGTNAAATVLRVFINNGLTNATAANNSLFSEIALASTTTTQVAPQAPVEIPILIILPATYKINVTLGTAGTAGWAVAAVGGSY